MNQPATPLLSPIVSLGFAFILTLGVSGVSRGQTTSIADFGITLNSPSSATVGEDVNLIVAISNSGPDPAAALAGVSLPPALQFQSATSGCAVDNNVVSCSVQTLNPGQSTTRQIVVAASQSGQFSVSAFVSPEAIDSNPDNNSDSTTISVDDNLPNLSLKKDDGGVTVAPGDNLTYTLVVTNTGVLATGVIITDTVPANTTFNASASTSGWSCADGAGAGTACGFNIGDLSSGNTAQTTLVVNVDPTLPPGVETISNTAIVTADGVGAITASDVTPINTLPPSLSLAISEVQSAGHVSPYIGQNVTISGTVTLRAADGYWLQDPTGDGDPATSEGIFISTTITQTVNVGDNVTVTGLVNELRHGGPGSGNLTNTEVISATTILNSSGNPLPAAVVIGEGGRIPPDMMINTDDGTGTVENPSALYLPAIDGIDFWESLEGMRVQVTDATVVGPTNRFGEVWVVGDNGVNAGLFTERGGLYITPNDFNPERIQLDYAFFPSGAPNVDVNATYSNTIGVIDYSFGNYELLVTDQSRPITITTVISDTTNLVPSANQFTLASYNVDLAGDAPLEKEKFNALASQFVNNLKSPTIAMLQDVGDDSGPGDDGIADSSGTLNLMRSTIVGNGGPSYNALWINPLNNQNSDQPGENPRNVILYNPISVTVTTRSGGDAVTPTTVDCVGGTPQLNPNPGLIDPTNLAWTTTAKPLVLEVQIGGETFYLINLNLVSQEADDPLFGVQQPPIANSQAQRLAQAQVVRNFTDNILACDPSANVIIAGGTYDPFSSVVGTTLAEPHSASLASVLSKEKRYNAVADGNSQLVDDIIVPKIYLPFIVKNTASLQALTEATPSIQAEVDIVHINAEFAQNKRVSDHDPIMARFTVEEGPGARIVPVARDSFVRQDSKDTNEGANLRLVVEKHTHTVVAFDLSGVLFPPTTATLELTVDKVHDWGQAGGFVDIHRLLQPFTEGNGFVWGQPKESVNRGSGPGVTHHCATDNEIGNNRPECDVKWKGGQLGATATPTARMLHSNSLTSGETVRWDVTADVVHALAAGANEVRWLIQKQGKANDGKVIYYSKEGDAGFGPRLILE
ncbi:MAG: hypothetical protein AB7G75_24620 [Candidatus Binatia bacterium]